MHISLQIDGVYILYFIIDGVYILYFIIDGVYILYFELWSTIIHYLWNFPNVLYVVLAFSITGDFNFFSKTKLSGKKVSL